MLKNLTHIVPRLPPAINGVGDYCFKLWDYWPETQQQWYFLVSEDASASQADWTEVKIAEFDKSTKGLVSALEPINAETVILHYVGYGYHPKGCPIWLPKALEEWKAASSERRLVVMFHELYATGKIWSSNFWVKPIAQKIIKDLILVADLWLTSCSRYQLKLVNEFAANPKQGALIPIGSNILPVEPVNFNRPWPLFQGEKLKVVIFGLAKTRLWALNVHAKFLKSLCDQGWVESITLAGSSELDAKASKKMAQHRADIGYSHLWHEAFDLTASQVSQLLATQDVGLISNQPDILTKSGVFAALSVHGVLSVICGQTDTNQDDLNKSLFLYNNSNSNVKLIEEMQNEPKIYDKKSALQNLIQNNLDWQKIAQLWVNHLEKLNKL